MTSSKMTFSKTASCIRVKNDTPSNERHSGLSVVMMGVVFFTVMLSVVMPRIIWCVGKISYRVCMKQTL